MQHLRDATALLLCCLLCLPAAADNQPQTAPAARPKYPSGQLQGDERILQALSRFTFGPRPGDLEAVRKMGLDSWFEEQLRPANMDETDLNAQLANFPAMQWRLQDLFYRLPSNPIIRQAAQGKVNFPASGTLHAVYENQIYRIEARRQEQAAKSAQAATPQPGPADGAVNRTTKSAENDVAVANPPQMEPAAAAPVAAGTTPATAMSYGQPSPPAFDDAAIQSILALPPQPRVMRLQSMQPEEFESLIRSLRPAQHEALTAGMSPELKEAVGDLENPERTVVQELLAQRLARDVYSNAQLQEVMTDFWLNHFNVYLRKNEQMPYYLVSYERDIIRPLALGRFEDLLEAVAHSPAMLLYLDNAQSIGPHSPAAERAKRAATRRPGAGKADAGLNENYARELMELHTVGVNGGYTQADVTQVARVLTGWTVDRPQFGGGFLFAPMRHEPGSKTVMGVKFKPGGEMEGRALLHMLATRPATAQFISRELAVRFVCDDPPQALVDRMAKAFLTTGGDIPSVLQSLFHSPEFWTASSYRAKVKTPLEFVVSALRASSASVQNYQPLVNALRQMGMPLYECIPPTGYKWDAADWVSTGELVNHMNFALMLAANRLPGITVEWAPDLDLSTLDSDAPTRQVIPTPESEEARLEPMLVAGGVSDATRKAALEQFQARMQQVNATAVPVAAERHAAMNAGKQAPAADRFEREDQLLAGLLLGSPEFQRR